MGTIEIVVTVCGIASAAWMAVVVVLGFWRVSEERAKRYEFKREEFMRLKQQVTDTLYAGKPK